MNKKGTICIDFDGTIYAYNSGWLGEDQLPDLPLEGVKEAIDTLKQEYNITIFSVRANTFLGKESIKEWLKKYDIHWDIVIGDKPNAIVFIDDRNIEFKNNWNEMVDKVQNFRTWNDRKSIDCIWTPDTEENNE